LVIVATVDAGARHKGKQARLHHHQQQSMHYKKSGRSAYAQASTFGSLFSPVPLANQPLRSTDPAHDVYVRGQYVGSDPDSRIRNELIRDWGGNN
jgi:hypothetical protein